VGVPTGLNPIVNLGENLRRPGAFGRITYATDAGTGLYLRSVTLEDLTGARWRPSDSGGRLQDGVDRIDQPQIRALLAQGTVTTTEISTASYTSPWLLAPYAPARIEGLEGSWRWDPRTLNIRGESGTTTANQQYTVLSVAPRLTRAVLADAPSGTREVDPVFSRLPANMPQVIRDTTARVTAGRDGPYEQALAIQQYLRGPEFTYSEQAPVDGGYDQTGFGLVAAFLQAKAGYCVHFASAMAIMAREAGIPSRIAVGYAPGRPTGTTVVQDDGAELAEYEVDSRDAHAWPELYFDNVGWVAFEPTPGRGVVPDYAQAEGAPAPGPAPQDNLDPRAGASADARTGAASPAAAPAAAAEPDRSGWAAALAGCVLLALLAPLLLRTGRRRRRRARLLDPRTPGRQSALLAWRETLDAAADYGQPAGEAESAREFEARLGGSGALPGGAPAAALGRLRAAYERAAYAAPGQDGQAAAGTVLLADADRVRAGLRAGAGLRQQLAARLLPRSVLRRPDGF
jgi:transglutaminase-like putative cysteine protease